MINISVILPYYNEADNISYTLNQICKQTYKPREIICINSNSSDNSSDIVKNKESHKSINILNFDTKINSASGAKNFGIKKSHFEWLAFMDCDMRFDLNWLEKQVLILQSNSEKKVVFGNTILYGKNLIDKCCIISTYGLERPSPTIPSSLVHNSLFFNSNNFFIESKSHYDSLWIKKNLDKEYSIINYEIKITYLGTNYASNYFNVFKKSTYYSSSLVDIYPIKALLFSLIFSICLIASIININLFIYCLTIYLILKLLLIPLIKNRSLFFLSKIKFHIHKLLIVNIMLDCGRFFGIINNLFFNILKKKMSWHYKH